MSTNKNRFSIFDAIDSIEIGVRLLYALFGTIIFGTIGIVLGSFLWEGLGMLLCFILIPLGAVYGFFLHEINLILKLIIKAIFSFDL